MGPADYSKNNVLRHQCEQVESLWGPMFTTKHKRFKMLLDSASQHREDLFTSSIRSYSFTRSDLQFKKKQFCSDIRRSFRPFLFQSARNTCGMNKLLPMNSFSLLRVLPTTFKRFTTILIITMFTTTARLARHDATDRHQQAYEH